MAEADIYNMSDVFISYSRKDSDFVHRLFDDIKATGKEVWADFEDIPKAADWWEEIKAGIDAADSFLFVISPDSVQSDICRKEIDHAIESNKRLLPILYREIIDDADKAKVHSSISSHNWIFFREQDNYPESFKILLESLETDLDHNRTLTRLLVRAKEWQDKNQKSSYLLQGDDLSQADDWLSHAMNKNPAPSNLHAEYIKASRTAEANRQRRLFIYTSTGMVISLLLAVFAVYQLLDARQARDAAVHAQTQADTARDQAEEAREQAERSEQEARAVALAASANEALANNNPDLALVLAQAAVELDGNEPTITTALADAAYAPGTVTRIEIDDVPKTAVYAPDASLFAAGFTSGNICLYDGTTYAEISCLRSDPDSNVAHSDDVLWLHINETGTRLLSSGFDDRLLLWDIEHDSPDYGTVIADLTIQNLTASALSSDGRFAILGTSDGRFGYWEVDGDIVQFDNYVHGDAINVIALNNDNSRALAGTANGVMLEYDVVSPTLINNYLNPNNLASISSVAYNPDATVGISGDLSASLTAWDLETGSIIRTYQGHDENVTAITFAANGRTMFTASWDNSVREWDVASGRVIQEFYGHNGGINALSLTADNLHMVSGGFDSSMRIWLVRPSIYDSQLTTDDEESVFAADWNETHIIAANEVGEIYIFNRNTGELMREFEDDTSTEEVFFLEIRPDDRNFVVVHADCAVSLFDMRGDTIWVNQLEEESLCRQVGFNPASDEILVLSNDEIYRLDGRSGETLGTVPIESDTGESPNFRAFAFTQNGTEILVGTNSRSDNLRLIDLETGAVIRHYVGHTDGVLAIDVSDDGNMIVSGSFDNNVRVWDFATGDLIWLLEGHSDRLLDVDFNPEGNSVVSSSNDTTMRLWDLGTGTIRYTYRAHTDRVVTTMFSHDGRRILTASHDSTLIIWRFPQTLEQLQTWISENRYIRELSCGERNAYLAENTACE